MGRREAGQAPSQRVCAAGGLLAARISCKRSRRDLCWNLMTCVFGWHQAIRSFGEVNGLIGRLLGEGLSAVERAHDRYMSSVVDGRPNPVFETKR